MKLSPATILGLVLAAATARGAESAIRADPIHTLRVSVGSGHEGRLVPARPEPAKSATPCVPAIATHTDADFTGGSFVTQQGFAETEIAAASYVLSASDFPLRVDLLEMIFYQQNAVVQTTTQWSAMIWRGLPSTGTLLLTVSSDGVSVPHLVLQPGTRGANVQVSIDPGDPVIVTDDGTHTFSIGYRIDRHNNQTQDPCFTPPPSNSNAFPTTDVSGLGNPTANWLYGINCGVFGCPPNGGWARFSQLSAGCRPTGDWVMRATIMPSFAAAEVANLTCRDGLDNDCDGFADCDDSDCGADSVCALTTVGGPVPGGDGRATLSLSVANPLSTGGGEFRITLPAASSVRLDLFDASGQVVRRFSEGPLSPGTHTLTWDGRTADGARVAPGVLFARLADGDGRSTVTKIVIVR